MPLFLRKTVIGGQTAPDDYVVIWEDLPIGRIFKGSGIGGGAIWSWSCSLPNVPQHGRYRGGAASLAEAKSLFERAWEELQGEISHSQIEEARRIAGDQSRPWHKAR